MIARHDEGGAFATGKRVLVAGLDDANWSDPKGWSVTRAPLAQAGYLLDYDLIILKPQWRGGLLDPARIKTDERMALAMPILKQKLFDLRVASMGSAVVLIPCERDETSWMTPRVLESSEYQVNRALGHPAANYDAHRWLNSDIVGTWGLDIWEGAGESLIPTGVATPWDEYLRLPVQWDASYAVYDQAGPLLTVWGESKDRRRTLAMHVEVGEYQAVVLPQAVSPHGLTTLVRCWAEWCSLHDRTRIRSSEEGRLLAELGDVEHEIQELTRKSSSLRQETEFVRAEAARAMQADAVMTRVLENYRRGLAKRDLNEFTLALEHLSQAHGGRHNLLKELAISKADFDAVSRVAQQGTRHVNHDQPGRRGPSDEEWDRAVYVMHAIIEKHWDHRHPGDISHTS